MRNTLRAAIVLSMGLFSGHAAKAADVYQRDTFKDTPSVSRATVTSEATPAIWGGFYIGGHVGYGNANHEFDVREEDDKYFDAALNLDGLNSSGFVGGLNTGYDVQRGRVVFGALGGYSWTGMETTASASFGSNSATDSLEKQDEFYLGGRAGILVAKDVLAYAGAAWVHTEYEIGGDLGRELREGRIATSQDYDGVKALLGVEMHIDGGVFAKLEYQHNFFGDVRWVNEDSLKVTDSLDEDIVLIGVSYKFNSTQF